jgi:hypothetical protein
VNIPRNCADATSLLECIKGGGNRRREELSPITAHAGVCAEGSAQPLSPVWPISVCKRTPRMNRQSASVPEMVFPFPYRSSHVKFL